VRYGTARSAALRRLGVGPRGSSARMGEQAQPHTLSSSWVHHLEVPAGSPKGTCSDMRKLSLRMKLGVGFGAVLLTLTITGLVSYVSMQKLDGLSAFLSQKADARFLAK